MNWKRKEKGAAMTDSTVSCRDGPSELSSAHTTAGKSSTSLAMSVSITTRFGNCLPGLPSQSRAPKVRHGYLVHPPPLHMAVNAGTELRAASH